MKLNYYHPELEAIECRPVVAADKPVVEQLIQEMIQVCILANAVGLAAPQIGHYIQVAVVRPPDQHKTLAMINPRITGFNGRDIVDEEACLSLPPDSATVRISRSENIIVESGTLDHPDARVVTKHSGYEARIISHEIDHLRKDGFIINRVSHLQRELLLKKYAKWRKRHGLEAI